MGVLAEVRRRRLAQRVRDAAHVVRHEADEEHRQDAEDAAVRLSPDVTVVAVHAAVGLVDPAGDGGVAEGEDQQGQPEQADAEEGGGPVPLSAQLRLQLHAATGVVFICRPAGQQDVGQHTEEEEAPGEEGHHPGEADTLQEVQHARPTHPGPVGGGGGGGGRVSDDPDVALEADEAHDEDPNVHGGVEEHGRVAAHDHMEAPAAQTQLSRQPEGEGGEHEDVGHHHVLQVHHQPRVAGHSEEDPGGQAVQKQPEDEDHEVQRRQDMVGEDTAVV